MLCAGAARKLWRPKHPALASTSLKRERLSIPFTRNRPRVYGEQSVNGDKRLGTLLILFRLSFICARHENDWCFAVGGTKTVFWIMNFALQRRQQITFFVECLDCMGVTRGIFYCRSHPNI